MTEEFNAGGIVPPPGSFRLDASEDLVRPFSYIATVRRRLRWQVVEFTGHCRVAGGSGRTVNFDVVGPLECAVHRRRFWLRRSVDRYLEQLGKETP